VLPSPLGDLNEDRARLRALVDTVLARLDQGAAVSDVERQPQPGPRVRVGLLGSEPVVPVMKLMSRVQPAVRRRDVRVALVVHTLLAEPYVTPALLEPSSPARRQVLQRRGLLLHRRAATAEPIVSRWLRDHPMVTSGDAAALPGLTQTGALRQLERLQTEGIVRRGAGMGRTAHFVAGGHLVVPNLLKGKDGKWSAVDSRAVHRHALTASYVYHALLRGELTARLGVAWTPRRRASPRSPASPPT
jgi:hypothetical protein